MRRARARRRADTAFAGQGGRAWCGAPGPTPTCASARRSGAPSTSCWWPASSAGAAGRPAGRLRRWASTPRWSRCRGGCGSTRAARRTAEDIVRELWDAGVRSATGGSEGEAGKGWTPRPGPPARPLVDARARTARGSPSSRRQRRTTSRRELARHQHFDEVSPEVGVLDEDGVRRGARRRRRRGARRCWPTSPDATDPKLPRAGPAAGGAGRARPDPSGPPRPTGRRAAGAAPDRPTDGDLDLDASLDAIAGWPGRGRGAPTPRTLRVRGWVPAGDGALPGGRPERVDGRRAAGHRRAGGRGRARGGPGRLQRAGVLGPDVVVAKSQDVPRPPEPGGRRRARAAGVRHHRRGLALRVAVRQLAALAAGAAGRRPAVGLPGDGAGRRRGRGAGGSTSCASWRRRTTATTLLALAAAVGARLADGARPLRRGPGPRRGPRPTEPQPLAPAILRRIAGARGGGWRQRQVGSSGGKMPMAFSSTTTSVGGTLPASPRSDLAGHGGGRGTPLVVAVGSSGAVAQRWSGSPRVAGWRRSSSPAVVGTPRRPPRLGRSRSSCSLDVGHDDRRPADDRPPPVEPVAEDGVGVEPAQLRRHGEHVGDGQLGVDAHPGQHRVEQTLRDVGPGRPPVDRPLQRPADEVLLAGDPAAVARCRPSSTSRPRSTGSGATGRRRAPRRPTGGSSRARSTFSPVYRSLVGKVKGTFTPPTASTIYLKAQKSTST